MLTPEVASQACLVHQYQLFSKCEAVCPPNRNCTWRAGNVVELKEAPGKSFAYKDLKAAIEKNKPAALFLCQVSHSTLSPWLHQLPSTMSATEVYIWLGLILTVSWVSPGGGWCGDNRLGLRLVQQLLSGSVKTTNLISCSAHVAAACTKSHGPWGVVVELTWLHVVWLRVMGPSLYLNAHIIISLCCWICDHLRGMLATWAR